MPLDRQHAVTLEIAEGAVIGEHVEPVVRAFERAAGLVSTVDDLHGLLRDLVERTDGVRAATLTDVEGLPVVTAGSSAHDAATETLAAELSSFLKNVRRTTAETGAGELESLAIAGPKGAAVVSRVHAGYSLILQVDPDAVLGEIRWEAARTARAIGPAVR